MAELNNETLTYVKVLLKRVILEMDASQSARLAVGFLDFDAKRFVAELMKVVKTIENELPEDYPETHPESYLVEKE
ncbi:MAG: hypothetical protein KAX49_16580 [Halanaerobiales bacterium]|nr:hypothetical protein [Halanaerobiales bacterium]